MRRSGTPSEALRVRMAAKIDEIDGRIAGFRLTATGERVLAGEANRVELLGIDRWIAEPEQHPGVADEHMFA